MNIEFKIHIVDYRNSHLSKVVNGNDLSKILREILFYHPNFQFFELEIISLFRKLATWFINFTLHDVYT